MLLLFFLFAGFHLLLSLVSLSPWCRFSITHCMSIYVVLQYCISNGYCIDCRRSMTGLVALQRSPFTSLCIDLWVIALLAKTLQLQEMRWYLCQSWWVIQFIVMHICCIFACWSISLFSTTGSAHEYYIWIWRRKFKEIFVFTDLTRSIQCLQCYCKWMLLFSFIIRLKIYLFVELKFTMNIIKHWYLQVDWCTLDCILN